MRKYKPKSNAQREVYYKDRFYVAPKIPRESIMQDAVYCADIEILSKQVKIIETYLERETLVIWVEKDSIYLTLATLKTIGYDVLSELSAIDYLEKKEALKFFIKCFLWGALNVCVLKLF